MPGQKSIFFDEWRACLHAHFEHVVRSGDTVTEPTLRHVLQQTGLTDEELELIRAEVLHASGTEPEDFSPETTASELDALEEDRIEDVDEHPAEDVDEGDPWSWADNVSTDALQAHADSAPAANEFDTTEPDFEDEADGELDDVSDAEQPADEPPPPPSQLSLF